MRTLWKQAAADDVRHIAGNVPIDFDFGFKGGLMTATYQLRQSDNM